MISSIANSLSELYRNCINIFCCKLFRDLIRNADFHKYPHYWQALFIQGWSRPRFPALEKDRKSHWPLEMGWQLSGRIYCRRTQLLPQISSCSTGKDSYLKPWKTVVNQHSQHWSRWTTGLCPYKAVTTYFNVHLALSPPPIHLHNLKSSLIS